MKKILNLLVVSVVVLFLATGNLYAQSTTASLSGTVKDEKEAILPNATVTARNTQTGFSRTAQTDGEGRFNFVNLPIGSYSLTVEAANFSKYVQTGITLDVNQNGVVDVTMKAGAVTETVTVTENASLLNTTTAEVSTRFDERRLSELPIAPNRNVFNVLLSVPGVSQLGSGQQGFANGISFSANGGRLRSNNFMIDGQDINDPSVSGGQIALNNPDAIQEVRIITNQFLPEYGRNSGSVVNFIGKSGTNNFRGSIFWFHNNKSLNSCSNIDKAAGFCNPNATTEERKKAPFRKENQIGFTFGGPLHLPAFGEGGPFVISGKDRTFFFVDYQKWTNRALGSGFTLNGAPTDAGRAILQSAAGNRPQVAALLRFVPAGTPNGRTASFTIGGNTFVVPLGNVTGTSSFKFDDQQGSVRIDHRFNEKNLLYGRYRWNRAKTSGTGQVTPPGLTTVNKLKTAAATVTLNSSLTSKLANEFRLAYSRFDSVTSASDPASETIPSIEINELGMTGFNAAANRTAIGLAVNLPQFRINNTYQITNSLSYTEGNHNYKFGVDFRKLEVKSFFFPTVRGRLAYSTLQRFIDDSADNAATINLPLAGGDRIGFYDWTEYYLYAQDEWKIAPNFTLTYGVRYENPGNSFKYLSNLNRRILSANGNNPAFTFTPVPKTDKNNFMPRFGFNWNPRTDKGGILGFITGGDKLVVRGGYSRTYDANFININLNIASSFPFVAAVALPTTNSFATLRNTTSPNVSNPNLLTRTIVDGGFRAPSTDQFSLEFQRELNTDLIFKTGYIHTRGRSLFQTLDGNARIPCLTCTPTNLAPRVDPTRGVIRLRANTADSWYHALQVSLDKRLSRNFSAGFHYTWSSFIDTASEIFNPSGAEVALAQDSFNIRNDKARSSYDRPHRLTGNFVFQIPFFEDQKGFVGKVLGGWQVNSFFTFQSGAPLTVLNGADPTGALSGIDGLVGSSIRPNLYTNLNVSKMKLQKLFAINQQLRNQAIQQAQQIFNALPPLGGNPCVAGPLGGPALPNILFATSVGRITCNTQGQRVLVVDFIGLPSGRVGNVGRNTLRADSIGNIDFGIIKNTKISETARLQFRADVFNLTNSRNFGIPEGRGIASNFLNQWATNGGNRRIVVGARLVF